MMTEKEQALSDELSRCYKVCLDKLGACTAEPFEQWLARYLDGVLSSCKEEEEHHQEHHAREEALRAQVKQLESELTLARQEIDSQMPPYDDSIATRREHECILLNQVSELHKANTRLLEEKRAEDQDAMVRQFHYASGTLPVRHSPHVPSDEDVRFRLRLIAEELFEMLDACFDGALQAQLLADARDRVRQCVDIGPLSVNLEDLVDAWADMKYVIIGAEASFGVDGSAVFRVVHETNMSKFTLPGGGVEPSGKVRKPPGFIPPDIAKELERQRQEEAKRT